MAFVVWWIADTAFMHRVFDTWFWPIIGVIFAPWTTLFYTIAWWGGTPQGDFYVWGYILVVIGILLDIATHGGGLWRSRKRMPGYA